MNEAVQTKTSLQERRGATSLWRIVADSLERDIRLGTYKPGDRLPTEVELADSFNVHRNTIRRALVTLRQRDFLRSEQGKGTFVKQRVLRHALGANSRLTAALRDIERVGERRFVGTERIRVTKELASDLRIGQNRFVRRVDTLMVLDDIPISITSSYFPLPRFDRIERFIAESGSFSESWKRYGVLDFRRCEARISATLLPKHEANLLKAQRGQAAIFIININVDSDDVPIKVAYTHILPQYMELVVRFDQQTL